VLCDLWVMGHEDLWDRNGLVSTGLPQHIKMTKCWIASENVTK
jgi:hypothetical protein